MFQANKGFTLIEVMAAVFVIAVTMVGLVVGFSYAIALVEELREISTADRIMQERMEELRGGTTLEVTSEDRPWGSITYTCDVDISPLIDSMGEVTGTISKVTVTVHFTSRTKRTISRSLVTYFAEGGITKTQ